MAFSNSQSAQMYFALKAKTTKDNKVASSQTELTSLHSIRIKLKKKKENDFYLFKHFCLVLF